MEDEDLGDTPESPVPMYDWIVCGRLLGQASGWDQFDTFGMQIYNLQPAPGYKGPLGECINLDFEAGLVTTYDEEGKVDNSMDLIEAIQGCEKKAL